MRNITLLLLTILGFNLAIAQTQLNKISRSTDTDISDYFNPSLFPFYHGVASGDPLQNRVIIWTRVTPNADHDILVKWKMATDVTMQRVVKSGTFFTNAERDYTVKLDVTGLAANQTYYYQFEALERLSPIGRTRTAPAVDVSQLRFAVVSCANYQEGYFNVYRKIAQRNDIDAVIHLGDYIYEYEEGGYGYSDDVGRGHEPEAELVSLDDYRVRHSYYKLDADLMGVHQQHPFICIWDDHEFANNAYKDGAENHQATTEGEWAVRKGNAWKAYFEWMPIRENPVSPNRIYRKINYGNLLDLFMIDTRIEGREEQEEGGIGKRIQAEYQKAKAGKRMTKQEEKRLMIETYMMHYLNEMNIKTDVTKQTSFHHLVNDIMQLMTQVNGNIDELTTAKYAQQTEKIRIKLFELISKNQATKDESYKSLLGEEQFNWLTTGLQTSEAKWKVVGNQVMLMPFSPLGLKDTWEGYQDERKRLYDYILNNNINNIAFLTGDIHMTFVGDLPYKLSDYNSWTGKGSVAVEFVTPSVTSANLDELVGIPDELIRWMVYLFNPHMKKINLDEQGYFVLDVQDERIQADWFYIESIKEVTDDEWFNHGYFVKNGSRTLKKASTASEDNRQHMAQAPLLKKNQPLKEFHPLVVLGNYPNPSNNQTIIHLGLLEKTNLQIQIYDLNGQIKQQVLNQEQQEGMYQIQFDTQNLINGVYLIKISNGKQTITKKMIIQH